jgi:hypothetical protein
LLPDFIIIGTQRGGTTSLYNYLSEHPRVAPARQKEIHYFSRQYDRGRDWYEAFFPRHRGLRGRITGEASPYYLFHPYSPQRVKDLCPDAKLICLLRDPVARAFSQYRLSVRNGWETLSFEDAIAAEQSRLAPELERLARLPYYESFSHGSHSYVSRGRYIEQLPGWMQLFGRSQLLIVRSEDLFEDAPSVYAEVLAFLGLPDHELRSYERFNAGAEAEQIAPETRRSLVDHFRGYNEELYRFLGRDFGW